MEILLQQVINGLVLGSMYALVALGYTMVYGIINLINFAHGEVLMVGALTSWTVVSALQDSGMPGWLLLLTSHRVKSALSTCKFSCVVSTMPTAMLVWLILLSTHSCVNKLCKKAHGTIP